MSFLPNNLLRVALPPELEDERKQAYMFLKWYKESKIRRWMEYDRRNEDLIKLAESKPGQKILDIGCAWGYSLMRLSSMGVLAYGIDVDVQAIEFGKRLAEYNGYKVDLRYANAKSLPFENEYFDTIICAETFEHIPLENHLTVFGEMKRVIKKGGKIVLSTPNPYGVAEIGKWIGGKIPFFREKFPASYRSHPKSYTFETGDEMVDFLVTKKDLKQYAKKLNLKIIRTDNIVFVLKIFPDWLFYPLVFMEKILESTPFLKSFASTSVYVFQKI
jgi:2-polyprenyl-3-methyl-5-hydroxy-6-metoxy-1,4-benzoquinol methylase